MNNKTWRGEVARLWTLVKGEAPFILLSLVVTFFCLSLLCIVKNKVQPSEDSGSLCWRNNIIESEE